MWWDIDRGFLDVLLAVLWLVIVIGFCRYVDGRKL
jgi:hypothetical protein